MAGRNDFCSFLPASSQHKSLAIFGSEIQQELDFAEQKNLALEQYLRDCERLNAAEMIRGEGLGNAFCRPFIPPKRKLVPKVA
jgi:hypothetical protein